MANTNLESKAVALRLFIGKPEDVLEPFNKTELFERETSRSNFSRDALYFKLNPSCSYLNTCVAALHAISRVYYCMKGNDNFGAYGKTADGGIVCEYYDGDIQCKPDKCSPYARKIVTYSKNGNVFGFISDNGVKQHLESRFSVMKKEAATGGFWMFHILCSCLLNENAGEMENKISLAMKQLYQNIEDTENGTATFDKYLFQELENDIYAYGVQNMDIPADFPEFSVESIKIDESSVIGKGTVIKSDKKTAPKPSFKENRRIAGFVKDGTFAIGNSSNTDNRYDDTYPCEHVVNICKLLKVNSLGKLPKKISQNIFFSGPAGTGKSTAAYQIARLLNLDYYNIVGSEDMSYADMVLNILPDNTTPGKFNYVESPLVKAFRDGGVLEFQEVNCVRKPSVLTALNSALDDNETLLLPTGETIKRNANTIVIFSANVDYSGTKPMNQALLSRCVNKYEFAMPDDKELVSRIKKDSGLDETIAEKMIKVIKSIKKVIDDSGIDDGVCSVRELLSWAKDTAILGTPYECAINTVVNGATLDSNAREDMLQAVQTQFVPHEKISCLIDNL